MKVALLVGGYFVGNVINLLDRAVVDVVKNSENLNFVWMTVKNVN